MSFQWKLILLWFLLAIVSATISFALIVVVSETIMYPQYISWNLLESPLAEFVYALVMGGPEILWRFSAPFMLLILAWVLVVRKASFLERTWVPMTVGFCSVVFLVSLAFVYYSPPGITGARTSTDHIVHFCEIFGTAISGLLAPRLFVKALRLGAFAFHPL